MHPTLNRAIFNITVGYKNQFRFEYKSDEDNEILLNDGYGSHWSVTVVMPEAEVNHNQHETGITPICYGYNCFTLMIT